MNTATAKQALIAELATIINPQSVARLIAIIESEGSVEFAEDAGKARFATPEKRAAVVAAFDRYDAVAESERMAEQKADADRFHTAYRRKHGFDYGSN